MAFTETKPGFKRERFKIEAESKDTAEVRIVTLEDGPGPAVKDFSLPDLLVKGKGDYRTIKSKYGPLAATDEDRRTKISRDSRFSVNPLLRDPLAIEVEERRHIDERVREQVDAITAQAREKGQKEGYEAGLKKGRDEAYGEFKTQAAASLKSFEEMVQGFEALKSEVFKANERFLMELVFRVAKMVALKELSTDTDYVLRLSRELLDGVGIRDNVKIHISAKDAQSIETLKAELSKTFVDLKNLGIEVSDDVVEGGCKIETQWSAIDATIETQLKGLKEALVGAVEK